MKNEQSNNRRVTSFNLQTQMLQMLEQVRYIQNSLQQSHQQINSLNQRIKEAELQKSFFEANHEQIDQEIYHAQKQIIRLKQQHKQFEFCDKNLLEIKNQLQIIDQNIINQQKINKELQTAIHSLELQNDTAAFQLEIKQKQLQQLQTLIRNNFPSPEGKQLQNVKLMVEQLKVNVIQTIKRRNQCESDQMKKEQKEQQILREKLYNFKVQQQRDNDDSQKESFYSNYFEQNDVQGLIENLLTTEEQLKTALIQSQEQQKEILLRGEQKMKTVVSEYQNTYAALQDEAHLIDKEMDQMRSMKQRQRNEQTDAQLINQLKKLREISLTVQTLKSEVQNLEWNEQLIEAESKFESLEFDD